MFVRVDVEEQDEIEGFCYQAANGVFERVRLDSNQVFSIKDNDDCDVTGFYIEDIPNLIKALQAAYDHVNKEKW